MREVWGHTSTRELIRHSMVTKWNPRWGDALPDDAYTWPDDIPIFPGDPMTVETTFPSQAIVDTLSGLNQIVAAKNRLALKAGYAPIFELEYSTMFNFDNWFNFTDERLIWPDAYYGFGDFFNTIKRQINSFYSIKELPLFPWTYPPPADPWSINKNLDCRFMNVDVNEIRKALDVSVPDQKIVIDATVGAYFRSDARNLPNVVLFPVPPFPPVPPAYLFPKLYECFNGGPDPVYPGRAFQSVDLSGGGGGAILYLQYYYYYSDNTPPHEDDYEFSFVNQFADFRGLIKPYFPLTSQISSANFLARAAAMGVKTKVVLAKRIDEAISEDPIIAGWYKNNASSPLDPPLCNKTVIAHPETYIGEFEVLVTPLFQDYRVNGIPYTDYHPLEGAKLPLLELALKQVFDRDMGMPNVFPGHSAPFVELDSYSIEILGPFL